MKTVYFIRHGESESNTAGVTSQIHSPLTKKGREQAEFAAERANRLPVDLMISSTQSRAKETAVIISEKIGKPITFSDLFVERRRPTEMRGSKPGDPHWDRIQKLVKTNFDNPGVHISDEENFHDLVTRAKKALAFLEGQKEESILVVSHGYFLKIIANYIFLGDDLTAAQFLKIGSKMEMENTGLTVISRGFDNFDTSGTGWKLWIRNDHAHLG
ncbi:MAG: histidine phosphatase family protein [Candidatus Vogelbacteria bacterium]|nr:histidine phosphatase family protein [Candidatus Vogelbacteria bacterium]